MASLKIKKGDTVRILSGKDKGKVGTVLKVMPSESRVLVSGVNVIKKHTKPSHASNGGIVSKEAPIHICKVSYYDSENKLSSKVGFKFENGKKVRFLKKNKKVIA